MCGTCQQLITLHVTKNCNRNPRFLGCCAV